MSTEIKGKKRKSGDNVEPLAKKVKVEAKVNKSADQPLPQKSALKGAKKEKPVKEKKSKTVVEVIEEAPEVILEAEPATAEVESEDDAATELNPDQTAQLLAGFSDSEDEEGDDIDRDADGIPIESLPALPKTEKAIARELKISRIKPKNNKGGNDPEATPGVIYISRLPHGFYEKQLRAYLSQFGDITNLRLARNKKSGKSQHHAFVEFAASSVADIVVKTMDKYLMFGHILQCKRVPDDQVKEGIWKGVKSQNGKVRPRNRIEGSKLRKGTDREGWEKRITRESERREKKAAALAEMGYDFEMPDVKAVGDVPQQKSIEQSAGAEAEDIVKAIQNGDASNGDLVEETVVAAVNAGAKGQAIVAEKTTKRKSKSGEVKVTTEKAKKRKTKAY